MRDRETISTGDIDQLLTDFFRDAQPKPWPRIATPEAMPREAAAPIIAMKTRSVAPGRFALAASVAFLAITGVWLAGLAPTPHTGPGVNLDVGTADRTFGKPPSSPGAPKANRVPESKAAEAQDPNTVRPAKMHKD